jgi:hypothetical protein
MLISAKLASEQIEQLTREERFNNKVEHAIKIGEREFSIDMRFYPNKFFKDKIQLFIDQLVTTGYGINFKNDWMGNEIIVSF